MMMMMTARHAQSSFKQNLSDTVEQVGKSQRLAYDCARTDVRTAVNNGGTWNSVEPASEWAAYYYSPQTQPGGHKHLGNCRSHLAHFRSRCSIDIFLCVEYKAEAKISLLQLLNQERDLKNSDKVIVIIVVVVVVVVVEQQSKTAVSLGLYLYFLLTIVVSFVYNL